MKILSVVSCPGIAGDAMWVRISNIAKALEINGHKVNLFHYLIKRSSTDKMLMLNTLKRYEDEYCVKSTQVCNIFSIFYRYITDLRSNKYDIIYGNTVLGAFIPVILKKIYCYPVILDMHGLPLEELKLAGSKNLLSNLFCAFLEYVSLNFSDKICCVSKSMIRYLNQSRNIPLNKLIYVPNGVDFNFFKNPTQTEIDSLKEELGIKDKFVFGYIGGLQKWQGLDSYIEAAKSLKELNVAFLFVGGDKKLIDSNIIYIPKVSRNEIIYYYSVCDVLVLPRPNNLVAEVAAPTKFAEYSSMGIPVLTTNVGDAASLVRMYKSGIVVDDKSPENLIHGIRKFLNLYHHNKNAIKQMGRNSRRLAEKEFNWEVIGMNLSRSIISLR